MDLAQRELRSLSNQRGAQEDHKALQKKII